MAPTGGMPGSCGAGAEGLEADFEPDFEADFEADFADREADCALDAVPGPGAAGCAGCAPGVPCGVLVCGAGSTGATGSGVPGRGIRCGRSGGVTRLAGSVRTRGAASAAPWDRD